MINLPNLQQPIQENKIIKSDWVTFFQQTKNKIKSNFNVSIGIPSSQQPIINQNGNVDNTWYSFFEKTYSSTGATFGIPSSQEKLGKQWNNFFEKLYQTLK